MLRNALFLSSLTFLPAFAQVVVMNNRLPVVVPTFPQPLPVRNDFRIRSVTVRADIQDQAAKVQVSQVFHNPSNVAAEAQVIFPAPEGAAISSLTLLADGKEITGRLLTKEEARNTYEAIVRRRCDPALLEYIGRDLYQTSVFPIPPNGESTVQIRYAQLLKKDSGLIDFLLPLGTAKHTARPIEEVSVTVNIAAAAPIRTVFSPTHPADVARPDATHATYKLKTHAISSASDLRLLYSTDANPVGVNVLSFKSDDDKEDGYFVLLATPDAESRQSQRIAKTVILVCDRSGSMSGKKMEQAKAALQFLLRQLQPGDTFNVVAYDTEVESFRPELQRADATTLRAAEQWVDRLNAGGGTNIDGAMRASLQMLNDSSRPNYVVFMTDGQPTAGETREAAIATNAAQANTMKARLFAFGVGYDVNSRLIDRLARGLRGQSVYVRPNENVEAPVSSLQAKVGAPVMTDVAVEVALDGGATSRVYPKQMPDLFRGDQLVMVGRYRKGGAAKVHLTGTALGKKESLNVDAAFAERYIDDSNGFVAKLWATRRIGDLIDEIDLHGKNQELVNELVALSQKHGILTPYTSFLADERVNLSAVRDNRMAAAEATSELAATAGQQGFEQRALKNGLMNAGVAGFAQQHQALKQVGQKAFFKKGATWQDSTVTDEQAKKAVHIMQFSREYFDLASSHGGKMAQYLAFEEPVLVNLGSQTYQIDPEGK